VYFPEKPYFSHSFFNHSIWRAIASAVHFEMIAATLHALGNEQLDLERNENGMDT
jgi:hypothetical protein